MGTKKRLLTPFSLRRGRIRVKMLLIIVGAIVLLGAAAVAARHIRRKILAERDLAAGTAAYERKDWAAVREHFREYLGRRPKDADVLRKYAEALLAPGAVERKDILRAIWVYRQLMNLAPDDEEPCRKLAALYTRIGNFSELAYVAGRRLKRAPGDAEASIWLARARLRQQKARQAREILVGLVGRLEKQSPKRDEYVQACTLLSWIEWQVGAETDVPGALAWLDRAVEYDSNSPEALLARAGFLRTSPPLPGRTREQMLQAAREDLDQAEQIERSDPLATLLLSKEWMHHGELDRAAALLKELGQVDQAVIREHFVDGDDWVIARFLHSAELSIRRGEAKDGAIEADEVLSKLTGRHKRLAVLPQAARVSLSAGRIPEARKHLDECLDLRKVLQVTGNEEQLAVLQARVAGAEGKPEEAVRVLEPLAARGEASPVVLRLLGMAYSQTGQTLRSIEALNRYLQRARADGRMWLLLAQQHGRRGNWRSAIAPARRAETRLKDELGPTLFRIEVAMHLARDKPAPDREKGLSALDDELAGLQKAHPRQARVHALLAHLMLARGRLYDAELLLKQAVKDLPPAVELQLQLAALYATTRRKTRAVEVCRAACESRPEAAPAWEALARYQQADGRLDEARGTLRRGIEAVAKARDRNALTVDLAMLEVLHGDSPVGIRLLKDVVKANPHDVQAASLLLDLPEVRRDRQTAQELLDRIRDVRGESSILWLRHQAALWFVDDRWRDNQHKIAETLEMWIRQNPQWPLPAVLLARMHQRLGRPGKAEQVCRNALRLNPSAVQVADLLVRLLEGQNRRDDARKVLGELRAGPNVLASRRIRMAIGAGDLTTAVRELKLQAAADPRDAAVRILLAQVTYARDRDLRSALPWLDQAEAIRPGSALVLRARVAMLRAYGKTEDARKLLDARVSQEGSPSAYLMRARFLAASGSPDLAEKDYLRLTEIDAGGRPRRLLAEFYRSSGRLDQAEKVLRRALKAHAEDLPLKRSLLELLLQRKSKNDLAEAERILDDLEASLGEQADLLWARAALVTARSPKPITRYTVEKMLNRAVKLEPRFIRGHVALVEMAIAEKAYARARSLARDALEANPGSVSLLVAQARVELASGQFRLATDLAGNILDIEARNGGARALLVSAAMNARDEADLRHVRKVVQRALAKGGQDQSLHLANARILGALGRDEAAISALEAYARTKAGSQSTAVLLALTRLQRQQGNVVKAAFWLARADSLLGDNSPSVLKERLWLWAAQKMFDEVVSFATAHDSTGAGDPRVLATAAVILASVGPSEHFPQAEKIYRRAVALAPQWPFPKRGLANLLYHMGKVDEAEELYRQVLDLDENNVHALNGLAWILAQTRKDCKAALPLIEKAVKLAPDDRQVRDTRGVILSKLPGRLSDARKDFEKCVELTATDSAGRAKALLQLGRVCERLDDHAAARKHLEEVLRIDDKDKAMTPEQRREIAEMVNHLLAKPGS